MDEPPDIGVKRKSVHLSHHAIIKSPKNETIDITKCVVCQNNKKSENLVTQPIHGRKTLLNKIKERANYLVNDYMSIDSKIICLSNSEKESVQYHRTCYSKATHQGHINKEKEKFNKTTSIKNETPNIYEDDNRFTRSKTKPVMKDHCFFCQSLDISKHHEIESPNTGKRLQSLIENSLRSELKVRLNTALNPVDARAIDVKYHKNCFKEELRKQKQLLEPKEEKRKDDDIGTTNIKRNNIETIVEIQIINAFGNEIRNGVILSMNDIKTACDDILHSYGLAHLKDERKFSKRSLKEIISKNIHHAVFTPQSNPNLPHLLHSNEVETRIVEDAIKYQTTDDGMKKILDAANILRTSILSFREQSENISPGLSPREDEIPAELGLFLKNVICGTSNVFLNKSRQQEISKMSNAHNIMYSTKTERQTSYKTQNDSSSFRIPLKNENNSVVGTGLVVRRFTRNARLINSLHDKGMSISNLRVLQIETALANCLIGKLEGSSSAKCLLPFHVDGEFVCFHFDNVDKCIDTQDGKNQLHGGLIVVFQAKMEEREVQPIWHDADLTRYRFYIC